MRRFRLILVYLLMLAIPLTASAEASLGGTLKRCPMQGDAAGYPNMAMSSRADCCLTMSAEPGKTDMPCKSRPFASCKCGHDCRINVVYLSFLSAAPLHPPFVGAQSVTRLSDTPFASRDPAGLWRPPRLL
jgi:hypothetical protein